MPSERTHRRAGYSRKYNAYYTRGSEALEVAVPQRVRKTHKKNVEKNMKEVMVMPFFNFSYLITTLAVITCIVILCISLLKLKEVNMANKSKINSLTNQLEKLVADNDDAETRIYSTVDYIDIYEKALEMGMTHVSQDQIHRYDRGTLEYVKQYENIPVKD